MDYKKRCIHIESLEMTHAGHYWCNGRDMDTGRHFISKSEIVVMGTI